MHHSGKPRRTIPSRPVEVSAERWGLRQRRGVAIGRSRRSLLDGHLQRLAQLTIAVPRKGVVRLFGPGRRLPAAAYAELARAILLERFPVSSFRMPAGTRATGAPSLERNSNVQCGASVGVRTRPWRSGRSTCPWVFPALHGPSPRHAQLSPYRLISRLATRGLLVLRFLRAIACRR